MLFLLFCILAFFYFWQSPFAEKVFHEQDPGRKNDVKGKLISERIGEKISYDLMLGKVRLGDAKYHHLKKTVLNGRNVHVITFQTKAVRFRDRETIYYDTETFLPVIIERKVSQFLKPEEIKEVYDQSNFKLTITKKRFFTEEIVIQKDAPIHNSILLPFFVRNMQKLKKGWSFKANLPQREYRITLVGIESVKVPAGTFEAYYFESKPKQIKIWISTDERRIPLRLEGTSGIGYKLLMREYSLPGSELVSSKQ